MNFKALVTVPRFKSLLLYNDGVMMFHICTPRGKLTTPLHRHAEECHRTYPSSTFQAIMFPVETSCLHASLCRASDEPVVDY